MSLWTQKRTLRLPWRWIIRGTCLGLLGLCVGLWGLSYVCVAGIRHEGDSVIRVRLGRGELIGGRRSVDWRGRPGWSIYYPSPDQLFSRRLLYGGIVTKMWDSTRPYSEVNIPFWCPTALLAIVTWIAWRKTRRTELARGFPIEPLASRRENAGG